MKVLSEAEVLKALKKSRQDLPIPARVFYSSWMGGMVKEPHLMMAPLDDHLVHRGDGIFEALRFSSQGIYLWTPHLIRMQQSAERVGLSFPVSENELEEIVRELIFHSGLKEGLLRIYLSRGPGGFSVSPEECPRSHLYMVVSELKLPAPELYNKGVSICLGTTPAKQGLLAQVKSCNYLINVLIKKQALDRGFDYGIGTTESGEVTEGSTENLLVLTSDNELIFATWDHVLKGTTLNRLLILAESLVKAGKIKALVQKPLSKEILQSAKALMLVGTTLGVLPVGKFETQIFQDFSLAHELHDILTRDIHQGGESKPLT